MGRERGRERDPCSVEGFDLVWSRPVVLDSGYIVPPREHWAMSGNISGYYTWSGDATNISWVESRDAAKHPAVHRAALQQRVIRHILSLLH